MDKRPRTESSPHPEDDIKTSDTVFDHENYIYEAIMRGVKDTSRGHLRSFAQARVDALKARTPRP